MKRLAGLAIALLFVAGIASAKEYEVLKKAGEYTVSAKIDKNPPIVGDNMVTIEVKDASGKYVTDAKVKVNYTMPAMSGMPAMHYETNAELSGNGYKANMNLSMSGSWNVVVKIQRGGKPAVMRFSVDAH
jgi:hypothetical protein